MVDTLKNASQKSENALRKHKSEIEVTALPGAQSKRLIEKIRSISNAVVNNLEYQEIVSVDIEEFEKLAESIKKKKTRKALPKSTYIPIDEEKWWQESAEIRDHWPTENFRNGKVEGYLFYTPGKSKWEKELVACIYRLFGKEHVLLHSRIAENPLWAWRIIKMLKEKYDEVAKSNS